jgi:soluble lytic murein transglycosylase
VKPGRATRLSASILQVAFLAACGAVPTADPDRTREIALQSAFASAVDAPARASEQLAEAGPGPVLERARLETWADCLERTNAGLDGWRQYLADRPPADLDARARLEIIELLLRDGRVDEALAERHRLPEDRQSEADLLVLAGGDPQTAAAAARRLAVDDPARLRRADRSLDQRVLSTLGADDRLVRARAWREQGSPARAAAELRSQRWRGENEETRRRELARAEIEAGAPLRALRVLPAAAGAEAEDLTLRASALRSRAWYLWPRAGGRGAFADCSSAAARALETGADGAVRVESLTLVVECATEAGRLDEAFEAWWQLEGGGWSDERRGWLGRRLGIAGARSGRMDAEAAELARTLPAHGRSIRYWLAEQQDDESGFRSLAEQPLPDLYALWALDRLGREPPATLHKAPAVGEATPPASVKLLLDAGLERSAARQWRRIGRQRSVTPAEALAASRQAAAARFPTTSIRWLRAGFPELGGIDSARAPADALETYLPLYWSDALLAAARESRVDPWLVAAIARQESGFVAEALSPRGAIGVLQLIPSTARGHARALGLPLPPDLRDPVINIRLGAREIAYLVRRFGAVEPALAAYNGGETRTRRWWRRQDDRRLFTEDIPIPETYNYIRRVTFLSEAYRLFYDEMWRSNP